MNDVLQDKVVVGRKFFCQNTLHLHQSLTFFQSFSFKHIDSKLLHQLCLTASCMAP